MRIAVQMDPIETMVVERDTSLALMLAAQARGHELWWWRPDDLHVDRGAVKAFAHRVRVQDDPARHYETLESRVLDLADLDVVLIRQDPPFDMAYVANTYLLQRAQAASGVMVLNDPQGVRDISEKLATLAFPDLTPATFVGRNRAALRAFAASYEAIVLKPSFFAGGEGVRKVRTADPAFEETVEAMLAEVGREPIVAQEFLPRVSAGDKRVLVLDGEPMGAVLRLPQAGDFRANLHVGGQAAPVALDDRDREIAARVAPLLRQGGVLLAGLDVIDGRLTEINVTSPTLVRQLVAHGGPDLAPLFWDAVERRRAGR